MVILKNDGIKVGAAFRTFSKNVRSFRTYISVRSTFFLVRFIFYICIRSTFFCGTTYFLYLRTKYLFFQYALITGNMPLLLTIYVHVDHKIMILITFYILYMYVHNDHETLIFHDFLYFHVEIQF